MPPRIQNQLVSNSLLPHISSSSSSSSASSLSKLTSCSSTPLSCTSFRSSRPFSSTVAPQTRQRALMFAWLRGDGSHLKNHTPGQPNYVSSLAGRLKDKNTLTKQPFPANPNFTSSRVLSEELRNQIHHRIMHLKESVRSVSVTFGVEMRRVAAVVRLVELQNQWQRQGKPMALPYARAVHEMIPTTKLTELKNYRSNPHESINDLPVHRLTDPQIFYPVPESRQFTRVDAGRVFSGAPALEHGEAKKATDDPDGTINRITQNPHKIEYVGKGDQEHQVLQPADVRIPHPHLVSHERDSMSNPDSRREVWQRYARRLRMMSESERERKKISQERKEAQTIKVQPEQSRFEFRISDAVVSKETTGADGRGHKAPGRRYGVPKYDRKRGEVKIPTRVEV